MTKRGWKWEKQKAAVALRYRLGKDRAPKVVAKGRGKSAEKILKLAREHQIPLYKDEALTSLLMKVEMDQAIPPELYRVVAEVLSMIYRMEKRAELLRREGGR
ncbi:MAG: EscU/YscU/HrcU family type III secretion system export apparatus switch protein [Thermicanus sp.]|nr:EscU/YscU/HrcU family type III secretion system export apparatus switch protein [Thermicanus sp.]